MNKDYNVISKIELIIMLFGSVAPFILAVQSLLQNHRIMTFMVESDQKDNLAKHISRLCLLCVSHTQSYN